MSESIDKQQAELADFIERYSGQDGVHPTAIPSLFFNRQSVIAGPVYGVFKPSLCIVVQGAKDVWLAQERFRYSPADYLVASISVPVIAQVVEATPALPYLSLKLEFTPKQVLDVLSNLETRIVTKKHSSHAIFVSRIETSLLEAVLRLVRLLENPDDIPVLVPLVTKEILYRILQGQHGETLEQIAVEGSYTYRIRNVIERLMNRYDQSFRIEDLAEMANMSVSSFHRHFKEVTAMSPLQFQKQLRLHEARRLLLSESADAAEVAFRVGYESPSQFSREYSRMFNLPPKEDMKRMKANYNQKADA
ncbi:arac-type transcriptional regulator n-terminus [Lucifera butyrica]|uniref:Arac-type transcriptional regulator n-terminus n=1 Tax=Lucifera butyrica TaxID=1351585 RepID=A0A498RET4_9FIRM|nr:AraC family transcriptional regulator [Lucifera butyrica]VBB08612.1 arac-type transcriptional regulator n-terminus [Lucifera butyrica]